MPQDQTTEQKRAAADAAKTTATAAREAANADASNADLKTAAETAEANATRLEAEAAAPSHDSKSGHKGPGQNTTPREKGEKRVELLLANVNKQRIAEGLKPLSVSEYKDGDDDGDNEGGEDDDKPITRGDLQRMGIVKTADTLAGEIQDADLRAAVQDELRFISKDLPAEQRYQKALGLASSSKNARVAQEAARVAGRTVSRHSSGAGGAPPIATDDGDFKPTPLEQSYMRKFGFTKENILKSRKEAAVFNFGPGTEDKD